MRYALGIEYDGSGFHGWQRQKQQISVQETVETALQRVANHPLSIICAGRTDTGVHALCQVVHFDSDAPRSLRSWMMGVNSNLPDSVSLLWIKPVPESFHARFTALGRRYLYRIVNRATRPAIDAGKVSWVRHPLNIHAMHKASQSLLGEHDFSSFRSSGCKANHPVRLVQSLAVTHSGNTVEINIAANGFLYHMVRNITGSLLDIGRGEKPVEWMSELLELKDRKRAGMTAPSDGLYFSGVRYPQEYGLPSMHPEAQLEELPG